MDSPMCLGIVIIISIVIIIINNNNKQSTILEFYLPYRFSP